MWQLVAHCSLRRGGSQRSRNLSAAVFTSATAWHSQSRLLAALCPTLLLSHCLFQKAFTLLSLSGCLIPPPSILSANLLFLCLCEGAGGSAPSAATSRCPHIFHWHTPCLESRNPPNKPCQPSATLSPTPTVVKPMGKQLLFCFPPQKFNTMRPARMTQWVVKKPPWHNRKGQWEAGLSQLTLALGFEGSARSHWLTGPGAALAPP